MIDPFAAEPQLQQQPQQQSGEHPSHQPQFHAGQEPAGPAATVPHSYSGVTATVLMPPGADGSQAQQQQQPVVVSTSVGTTPGQNSGAALYGYAPYADHEEESFVFDDSLAGGHHHHHHVHYPHSHGSLNVWNAVGSGCSAFYGSCSLMAGVVGLAHAAPAGLVVMQLIEGLAMLAMAVTGIWGLMRRDARALMGFSVSAILVFVIELSSMFVTLATGGAQAECQDEAGKDAPECNPGDDGAFWFGSILILLVCISYACTGFFLARQHRQASMAHAEAYEAFEL